MNYCKHLKKRKNKPYCNIIRKEITFSCCRECVNKEYKINTIFSQNSANTRNKNKKCTIFVKNGTFCSKNAQNNQKTVHYLSNNNQIRNSAYSLQNSAKSLHKMKNKSNKLAKLERKRFSVFTNNMNKCYFCDNPRMDKHEIYRGKNRPNSMKFGFVLPMCRFHHDIYQNDVLFNEHWHKIAQRYFEDHYGTRDDFIATFRKNYLD